MEDKIGVNFKEEWGEGVNHNEFDLDMRKGNLGFLKAFLRTFLGINSPQCPVDCFLSIK
jgi:hypothetical protein